MILSGMGRAEPHPKSFPHLSPSEPTWPHTHHTGPHLRNAVKKFDTTIHFTLGPCQLILYDLYDGFCITCVRSVSCEV